LACVLQRKLPVAARLFFHSLTKLVIGVAWHTLSQLPILIVKIHKRGVPVVLELTSLDRAHGFRLTEFGIRADIKPEEVTRVRLVPQQTGRFAFACDVFCGVDHDEMAAEIVVVD
jgi:heme/copper-type cytochrome/quinol oxidase subunit 2